MKKLLLPFLFFVAVGSSAQKVSSKLVFQKGQKLEIVSNVNTTTEMMMNESNNNAISTEVYEVKDVADDNITLERSMKKIKMNISIMGQEKSIDSDNPEDLKGMIGEPIKELLNTRNEFTVNNVGKIVAVKGGSKKKSADNGMAGMFLQQMNLGSGLPAVGQASFFKVLPDYEVGKGDTWTDTVSASGTTMKTVYTLKDITDNEILIDYISDGKVDTKQDVMGTSIEVKGTVKMNGAMTLDKATGLLKQKTITNKTETASNFGGQEMNINSKSTTVVTVKPI